MSESPLFSQLKKEGKTSKNPLKESFGNKRNFKMVLLALFGATMGQGVIWYTSQFYAQNFILTKCFVEYEQANTIILIALLIATPFFVLFGALSDKIGRKNIILLGMFLGIVSYHFIFQQLYEVADVSKKTAQPQMQMKQTSRTLTAGKEYVQIQAVSDFYTDGSIMKTTTRITNNVPGSAPPKKEIVLGESAKWKMVGWIALMVIFVTMVYGPIAAFLVELFPTKIRYTSMSLPYHIGNGVFGGLVPFIATLITTIPGANHLSGLWYPVGVAILSFIIGALYLNNRIDKNVADR
jgi:MFS family permease